MALATSLDESGSLCATAQSSSYLKILGVQDRKTNVRTDVKIFFSLDSISKIRYSHMRTSNYCGCGHITVHNLAKLR
jgi:hypothetical protein